MQSFETLEKHIRKNISEYAKKIKSLKRGETLLVYIEDTEIKDEVKEGYTIIGGRCAQVTFTTACKSVIEFENAIEDGCKRFYFQ